MFQLLELESPCPSSHAGWALEGGQLASGRLVWLVLYGCHREGLRNLGWKEVLQEMQLCPWAFKRKAGLVSQPSGGTVLPPSRCCVMVEIYWSEFKLCPSWIEICFWVPSACWQKLFPCGWRTWVPFPCWLLREVSASVTPIPIHGPPSSQQWHTISLLPQISLTSSSATIW